MEASVLFSKHLEIVCSVQVRAQVTLEAAIHIHLLQELTALR